MLPADGCSKGLQDVGTLPHHYTVSQPKRPPLETAPSGKPQISSLRNKVNILRSLKLHVSLILANIKEILFHAFLS
jgi:hypothetical protein